MLLLLVTILFYNFLSPHIISTTVYDNLFNTSYEYDSEKKLLSRKKISLILSGNHPPIEKEHCINPDHPVTYLDITNAKKESKKDLLLNQVHQDSQDIYIIQEQKALSQRIKNIFNSKDSIIIRNIHLGKIISTSSDNHPDIAFSVWNKPMKKNLLLIANQDLNKHIYSIDNQITAFAYTHNSRYLILCTWSHKNQLSSISFLDRLNNYKTIMLHDFGPEKIIALNPTSNKLIMSLWDKKNKRSSICMACIENDTVHDLSTLPIGSDKITSLFIHENSQTISCYSRGATSPIAQLSYSDGALYQKQIHY
jgi:hypothetical protein